MESTHDRDILELDHRSGNGIDVGLYWDRWADQTYLVVADEQTGACFRMNVAASRARDAFLHPFVYGRHSDRLISFAPSEWIGDEPIEWIEDARAA
jgi:hypothetical protein